MNDWFPYNDFKNSQSIRLLCFHHSGGCASVFKKWQQLAPKYLDICPVQLPGRENRYHEDFITDITDFIQSFISQQSDIFTSDYALFGHSLGGLVSYCLTQEIQKNTDIPLPKQLFISASLPPKHLVNRKLHKLPRDEFIKMISSYGGLPTAILQNTDLMNILVQRLRSDFCLYESFDNKNASLVNSPIHVFSGSKDTIAPHKELHDWRAYTNNAFDYTCIDGDHFFHQTKQEELLAAISKKLCAVTPE